MTKPTRPLYRIRNHRQYTTALINRGSLSVWFDSSSIDRWLNHLPAVRRGRPLVYADAAIFCALLIREAYHLPLRQTQGLIGSLFLLLNIDLPVPHYSTLCRRARKLCIKLSAAPKHQALHLLVDSSGFKVYGEGEWYTRLRKQFHRRTWRKLHIAVDHQSGMIVSATGSHKDLLDRNALPNLLEQIDQPVAALYGDGVYDFRDCYKVIFDKRAKPVIPPKQRAVVHEQTFMKGRNLNILQMKKLGLEKWKKKQRYHRRSLVETAFYRLKRIFSDRLRSKRTDSQDAEMMTRCEALNRMTGLGMPESYAV
jgi:hypothetical protein